MAWTDKWAWWTFHLLRDWWLEFVKITLYNFSFFAIISHVHYVIIVIISVYLDKNSAITFSNDLTFCFVAMHVAHILSNDHNDSIKLQILAYNQTINYRIPSHNPIILVNLILKKVWKFWWSLKFFCWYKYIVVHIISPGAICTHIYKPFKRSFTNLVVHIREWCSTLTIYVWLRQFECVAHSLSPSHCTRLQEQSI